MIAVSAYFWTLGRMRDELTQTLLMSIQIACFRRELLSPTDRQTHPRCDHRHLGLRILEDPS